MKASDAVVTIGEMVTLSSTSYDLDGSISVYNWSFGDGSADVGGDMLSSTTHQFALGGFYWVLHRVTDDQGASSTNEKAMTRVYVSYYDPFENWYWENDTHPYAVLSSDVDFARNGTIVNFNMTGSFGVGGWSWLDPSAHYQGQNLYWGYENITLAALEYGDGSATENLVPGEVMTAAHMYRKEGHFAAEFTVQSWLTTPYTTKLVSTTVARTIHISNATSPPEVKSPRTFMEATIDQPQSLDPAREYWDQGGTSVLQNVYETLVWYDGASAAQFKPLLATEVPTVENGGISPDGLNYTFNLRSNVKFHDGRIMTADDATYSFQRILRIHDPNGPSWMLDAVVADNLAGMLRKRAEDRRVYQWTQNSSANASWIADYLWTQSGGGNHTITQSDVDAVAALAIIKTGAMQLLIRLTHPVAAFLSFCAQPMMSVVSSAFILTHGGVSPDNHYMDTHTCGTGPFEMVEWSTGLKVHLSQFKDYWNPSVHGWNSLDDVYVLFVPDMARGMQMLEAGDVDTANMPLSSESLFSNGSTYTIEKGDPGLSETFFVFNFNIDSAQANSEFGGTITDDFFQDVHMRRAFVSLFNYSLFLHTAYRDNALQLKGPIPRTMAGYDGSVPGYHYDLQDAVDELKLTHSPISDKSWFETGFTIPLFFNSGNVIRQTACQLIKNALETITADYPGAGPITATVTALDWSSAYLTDVVYSQHSYAPMYAIGWAPDYSDPDDFCTPLLDSESGTYPYFSGYSNLTIDALVRSASKEVNESERAGLYTEIQWAVHNDTPYLWLTENCNFTVFRSWIGGYYYNPMYGDLYYAALTKGPPNSAPIARFTIEPASGDATTVFTFDASQSNDAEDPPSLLLVEWDWDGDGVMDIAPSAEKTATHSFAAGEHNITLRVTDTGGATNTTSVTLLVLDTVIPEFPPVLGVAVLLTVMTAAVVFRGRKQRQ